MTKLTMALLFIGATIIALIITKKVLNHERSGSVVHYSNFPSEFVVQRPVEVWLPEGYDPSSSERYPVIYMHDGQFLFLGSRSWYTWTPWNWNVDVTIPRMIREKKIRSAIVVAPWMLPKDDRRRNEYMPQKPITREVGRLLEADKSDIKYERLNSDNYLKFLVEELKPYIDKTYKTSPEKDNTFTMGSSMGGMISAYAISEYPDIFGGAACMSTHWSDANGAVVKWYQNHWPEAGDNRLYFDYGTESYDAAYEPYQQLMDETMRSKGYTEGRDWVTRKFQGASHRPSAWRDRLHIPLEFLLGTDK